LTDVISQPDLGVLIIPYMGSAMTAPKRIAKDDPGVPLRPGLGIRLTCDECGREIAGKPEVMRVGESTRYFCCRTCLGAYKEKYGFRLNELHESGAL